MTDNLVHSQPSGPKLLDATEERELFAKRHSDAARAQPKIQAKRARDALVRQKNHELPSTKPATAPAGLPSKFSWEDQSKVTPIKNQNPAGTCWAFADVGH